MSEQWATDSELESGIAAALRAGDMSAVEALLGMLARQNPSRCAEVVNAMKTGVALRKEAVDE